MKLRLTVTFAIALMTILSTMAAGPTARSFSRSLWPNGAPHDKTPYVDWNGNPRDKVDVGDVARVYVFLPQPEAANGKAVVLCPGGGYRGLCMGYEGRDWAEFFNTNGIALIVLQYRLPDNHWEVPVEDVQEAIRLVRRNAKAWGIDPEAVGVGGSSAGGHLASTAATHFDRPVNTDTVSCRPDFQILFYPVISMMPELSHHETRYSFLGPRFPLPMEIEFSNDRQVTSDTPRAWIGLSDDDALVPPMNSINYYAALHRAGVPAALYIYPTGNHGWGILPQFAYHDQMLADLAAWLRSF